MFRLFECCQDRLQISPHTRDPGLVMHERFPEPILALCGEPLAALQFRMEERTNPVHPRHQLERFPVRRGPGWRQRDGVRDPADHGLVDFFQNSRVNLSILLHGLA